MLKRNERRKDGSHDERKERKPITRSRKNMMMSMRPNRQEIIKTMKISLGLNECFQNQGKPIINKLIENHTSLIKKERSGKPAPFYMIFVEKN